MAHEPITKRSIKPERKRKNSLLTSNQGHIEESCLSDEGLQCEN